MIQPFNNVAFQERRHILKDAETGVTGEGR